MQKHPDITRRRVDSFIEHDLRGRLIAETVPLKAEVLDATGVNYADLAQHRWKPVEPGYRYGPAYTTFWFRVTGEVPASWDGAPIVVDPAVGSERTWWLDGRPYQGVDHAHEWVRMPNPGKVSMLLEAYTRNPQCRVHGREPERDALVESVEHVAAHRLRAGYQDLLWDLEFATGLLDTLDKGDPSYALLLTSLNTVINGWRPEDPDAPATARRTVRYALGALAGEVRHTVYACGHAHLDTAWLWPMSITRQKMAHTTANQLRLLERFPQHHFAHSQASQYEWLELEYPRLFAEVKEAIARGQWEPVGSMWVEADCNLTGAESLVRQFLYGRRYFREKLGVVTKDMWLPDVFGYSAAIPQILNKMGIEAFMTQKISWNQTNRFPHNTFWWQGIDGSRIWTHFPPADTYCGSGEPKEIVQSVKSHRDHARSDASLYLYGFGDGGGGPTERHIELITRAVTTSNMPEVAMGRAALDFFREVRSRSRDLMTWSGELYLEFHRGTFTSQAANKRANRVSEFLLRDAEWLACFRPDFAKAYPAAELEAAWKLVLLNQFHDIIPGSSVGEVYVDSAKDYAKVAEIGERVVRDSLEAIGAGFDTSESERPIALFHNSTMESECSIPWTDTEAPGGLMMAEEHVPVQLVELLDERKLVFATPSSALGAVAVGDFTTEQPPTRGRLKASARRLENDQISVRFDAHGNITGIVSLDDGTEFVKPGELANQFQLFDDKPLFWSAWDVDPFVFESRRDLLRSESFEVVERGPVRCASKLVKRFGDSTLTQIVSLGPTPGIRFDTVVDWHEEDKMLKVAFPTNLNVTRATFEIQFGSVERPTHENTSWDVARFESPAQKWVDVSEGDLGVALINDCKYGHDVKGSTLRLSLLRSPKAPDPNCDMGRHRFTYVLLPHFGPHTYAGVVQAAYAVNAPLRYAWLKPKAGEHGVLPPLVSCEDRNVVVETVKRAEDGKDLIVRCYECHNSRGAAQLSCLRPVRRAWLCDLEENNVAELEITDRDVRFDYKPFEIITMRLEI